jgi:hypothetical protein
MLTIQAMRHLRRRLWRIPLLFGAGALLAYGARAAVSDGSGDGFDQARADQHGSRIGEVLVKLDNDQIYFSQDAGRTFQELPTAATQATRLKRLLQQGDRSGPGGAVSVSPTVVADGAGGSQWARPKDVRVPDSPISAEKAAVPGKPVSADKARSANGAKEPDPTRIE